VGWILDRLHDEHREVHLRVVVLSVVLADAAQVRLGEADARGLGSLDRSLSVARRLARGASVVTAEERRRRFLALESERLERLDDEPDRRKPLALEVALTMLSRK
jgi:hypothetical protein